MVISDAEDSRRVRSEVRSILEQCDKSTSVTSPAENTFLH
jgi:hypothetical protein